MAADLSALLGGGPSSSAAKRDGAAAAIQNEERRKMLRRYDHVSAQILNPFGKSAIHDCNLKSLWEAVKKGNKSVNYFSEFCAEDAYRRGIAVSRLAEVLESAEMAIKDTSMKAIVKEDIYKKFEAELEELMPSIKALNGGKASQSTKPGFSSLYATNPGTTSTPTEIKNYAGKLYDWLSKDTSPLRGFLAIMSMGGTFYSAFVAEKTARAAIHSNGGKLSKEEFMEAATSRLCSNVAMNEEGNTGGAEHKGLLG